MRMYQEIGLTVEAKKWLEDNCQMEEYNPCPHCGKFISQRFKVIRVKDIDSFYGDGPFLKTYLTHDGKEVSEIVQAEPWSSGPMAFFCLKMDGIAFCKWANEEIDEMCR